MQIGDACLVQLAKFKQFQNVIFLWPCQNVKYPKAKVTRSHYHNFRVLMSLYAPTIELHEWKKTIAYQNSLNFPFWDRCALWLKRSFASLSNIGWWGGNFWAWHDKMMNLCICWCALSLRDKTYAEENNKWFEIMRNIRRKKANKIVKIVDNQIHKILKVNFTLFIQKQKFWKVSLCTCTINADDWLMPHLVIKQNKWPPES